MRLTDLLDRKVVTESGESLGRAFDFRAELTPRKLELTGIVVARQGLLERLGVVATSVSRRHSGRARGVVPWAGVVRYEKRTIVVRDDAKPRS